MKELQKETFTFLLSRVEGGGICVICYFHVKPELNVVSYEDFQISLLLI
jgi:hypothetical protein